MLRPNINLGIIGNGFVGKATSQFASSRVEVKIYDVDKNKCIPVGTTIKHIINMDIVMICVPTPMSNDGSCSTKIVESVIHSLREHGDDPLIVVRSTVPVGFCKKYGVYFMPEFLTEANFEKDFYQNSLWIIGADDDKLTKKMNLLLHLAFLEDKIKYNNIRIISSEEAEMVKYFRNCFLAAKVSICNEFYSFCKMKNINYDNMIQAAAHDHRIGLHHTKVPGPDGLCGFGGTCFPKDISSMIYQMNKNKLDPVVLKAVEYRNNHYDRSEQDWKNLKGRAIE